MLSSCCRHSNFNISRRYDFSAHDCVKYFTQLRRFMLNNSMNDVILDVWRHSAEGNATGIETINDLSMDMSRKSKV